MNMPTKVPQAINDKKAKGVHEAIKAMKEKQMKLAKHPFKASDLLSLFVDPQHHHALMMAYELCEPSGHTQDLFVRCEVPREYGGGVTHLRFHWHGLSTPHAFYVPYRKGSAMDHPAELRPEAKLSLVEKFEQVRDDMIGIAYHFAQVQYVFNKLNRPSVCSTLGQLRYHWPCIVPLLRKAKEHGLADLHSAPSARAGDGANIPPELGRLLAPTNMTIANHQLIDDVPDPEDPPITYELRENFRRV